MSTSGIAPLSDQQGEVGVQINNTTAEDETTSYLLQNPHLAEE